MNAKTPGWGRHLRLPQLFLKYVTGVVRTMPQESKSGMNRPFFFVVEYSSFTYLTSNNKDKESFFGQGA
jgi:hypothetical protein